MSEELSESPKTIGQQRRELIKDTSEIDPSEARKMLEDLGYPQDSWVIFIEQDLGSHYLRVLAHIATGGKPRILEDVDKELFPDEHHGPMNEENNFEPNFTKQSLNTKLKFPEEKLAEFLNLKENQDKL